MNLTTVELAQLRADQADYWPDTCTIQTRANTRDTQGGFTPTFTSTYTSVSCRLAPMTQSGVETIEGGQVTAVSRWVLTVAYNQALDETMRVVHASETFEVEHLEDTHSNRTAKRAYLRRLD